MGSPAEFTGPEVPRLAQRRLIQRNSAQYQCIQRRSRGQFENYSARDRKVFAPLVAWRVKCKWFVREVNRDGRNQRRECA
jgi:hypothetical protein